MTTRIINVEPSLKARPRPLAINGPLTENVVRSLWTRGGSDEYGIDAHRLNIQSIESFGKQQCNKVRELDLSFNKLVRLNCLHEIPSLQVLKVHANCLKELDEYEFPKKSNIEVLFLSGNQLNCIPRVIGSLRKLKQLRLDSNRITGIPVYDSMYSCRKLIYLNLSRNKITSVKGLESIGTLETLVLASNDLETLHPVLRRLDNLQDLDLSGNRITSLTPLRGIRKLSVLRISDNRIGSWKEIPPIATLTEFHARGNRLTTAPPRPDDFPILDVLDIGDNRIGDMNSLTDIVRFKGLMSLRVEGNPVCREDHAIVQTLVNEMPELLVIDGIDASIYGGGTLDIVTPRSVLQAVERKNRKSKKEEMKQKGIESKTTSSLASSSSSSSSLSQRKKNRSPSKKNSPSKNSPSKNSPNSPKHSPKHSPNSKNASKKLSKTTESFTLSIANIMTGYDAEQQKRASSSQSTVRPSIVPNLHVAKSQAGSKYGLRRPLSARGAGPASPRNVRGTGSFLSGTGSSKTSGISSGLDLSSFGRPVARAASLRTGRGTGLKQLEDVEDMARTFRKTIASERNILVTCAPSPDDEAASTDGRNTMSEQMTRIGGGSEKEQEHSNLTTEVEKVVEKVVEVEMEVEVEGKNNGTKVERREEKTSDTKSIHQSSRTTGRSRRQHRSLKAALAYSRKDEEICISEGKNGDGDLGSVSNTSSSAIVSPTNSENSRSTVTDGASPSPNGSDGASTARMLEEISIRQQHKDGGGDTIDTMTQLPRKNGWSSRPSSAQTKGNHRGSIESARNSSSRRRKKSSFGAFRVPKGAKRFVNSTLDEYEK